VFACGPAAALYSGSDYRMVRSEATVMEPLGHGVPVLDRIKCGFGDLVVSLEPEGSAGRFALAAAPAPVGQGQAALAGAEVGAMVQLHPVPSTAVVSKTVSKIRMYQRLKAGTGWSAAAVAARFLNSVSAQAGAGSS